MSIGAKERRDRKRARRSIIKPKSPEPVDSDVEAVHKKRKRSDTSDVDEAPETELTVKKKKRGRGKAAPGITLMETFTANNVKKTRLTVGCPICLCA